VRTVIVKQIARITSRPPLLTIRQVGEELNLSRTSVYELIRLGLLPLRKIGGKSLVLASDVDDFVASLRPINNLEITL
jgi:excisionase family DNA binding protein